MNTILSCIRIAMDLPYIVHIIYYRSKTVCYQCQSTYTCNLINAISSKTEDHTIKQASKTWYSWFCPSPHRKWHLEVHSTLLEHNIYAHTLKPWTSNSYNIHMNSSDAMWWIQCHMVNSRRKSHPHCSIVRFHTITFSAVFVCMHIIGYNSLLVRYCIVTNEVERCTIIAWWLCNHREVKYYARVPQNWDL